MARDGVAEHPLRVAQGPHRRRFIGLHQARKPGDVGVEDGRELPPRPGLAA
jgi:hypothetical protein